MTGLRSLINFACGDDLCFLMSLPNSSHKAPLSALMLCLSSRHWVFAAFPIQMGSGIGVLAVAKLTY